MKLVLFDFDGTLTTKDSFIEFIKHSKGRMNFLLGFLLLSPVLIMYKIGLIKNWKAKELVLTYFFKGQIYSKFQSSCRSFAFEKIDRIINPSAMNRLMERKNESSRIIIVSASVEDWIRPWSEKLGVELIGTRMEVFSNKLTGNISGRNCYGIEKVKRIKEVVDLSLYEKIEAYGDSSGDFEMMSLATEKFYKTF
jgi:phosphatidylglycerophosphatase C